jgi:exosome complex component RRP4
MSEFPHVVVPGQVIAVSTSSSDSFLHGHGTYVETIPSSNPQNDDTNGNHSGELAQAVLQLRAAVAGTVQRVNKLITVESVALHTYQAHVGDLIVGRVTSIGAARWNIDISSGNGVRSMAQLPLSGVHLPGAVQRVKTATDALEMRRFIAPGDLVSCEVHKVMNSTSILLHTRSVRYGKLENGCVVSVPARLVPSLKSHYTTLLNDRFAILLGCNGLIWLQRHNNRTNHGDAMDVEESHTGDTEEVAATAAVHKTDTTFAPPQELAEAEEERRSRHAATTYSWTDRHCLARLRNAVLCLRQTLTTITPAHIEAVYAASLTLIPMPTSSLSKDNSSSSNRRSLGDMLLPENVVKLTAPCRT